MTSPLRSGFVCLLGRPNVGKSTLVNRMVGRPISITAPKPQTTRNRILGVQHGPGYQVVYVDTPGVHEPTGPLNRRMVGYALGALADADLVLMLVEPCPWPAFALHPGDALVLERVREAARPTLLVINKIDRVGEGEVLRTIEGFAAEPFGEIVPLSALTGRGVARLEELIQVRLPEGPPYFDPHQVTDQPEAVICAELVRQEVFRRLHQEVPYSTAVQVEDMTAKGDLLVIQARIYVEWDSQKGILIGKGGRMLKAIGQAARKQIERMLGTRVFLELDVRVLKEWSTNPRRLTDLGYPDGG